MEQTALDTFFVLDISRGGARMPIVRYTFFAVISDPFLQAVDVLIDKLGDAVTRACADVIGSALSKLFTLLKFRSLFKVLEWASCLKLGFWKRIIIPTAVRFSPHVESIIREWLAAHLAEWYSFSLNLPGNTSASSLDQVLAWTLGADHLPSGRSE